MSDSRALVRVLDELLWSLRRERFDISPAQAIDVARSVQAIGVEDRQALRVAIGSIVVSRRRDVPRFRAAFDAFFDPTKRASGHFWQHLSERGFSSSEQEALRELLREIDDPTAAGAGLSAILEGGAGIDRLFASSGVRRSIDAHSDLRLGFEAQRLARHVGADRARLDLAQVRKRLIETWGERGGDLADTMAEELDRMDREVRDHVFRIHAERLESARQQASALDRLPFSSLTDVEAAGIRAMLRRFAERLRGAARARARRATRGPVDPSRTLRGAMRTAGVPFRIVRCRRLRARPKWIVLCDVSDSVRGVARFFLELTYSVQEIFDRARSFVFVSDLGETTALFAREHPETAVDRAWQGTGLVRTNDNSNYGRALRTFWATCSAELDRRTTVVVLGDGRSNYGDLAADVLDAVRRRSAALYWLCPEPRGEWSKGDSAMSRYAPKCTAVYEVACVADLERAMRAMIDGADRSLPADA